MTDYNNISVHKFKCGSQIQTISNNINTSLNMYVVSLVKYNKNSVATGGTHFFHLEKDYFPIDFVEFCVPENLSKKFGTQINQLWDNFGTDFTYPGNFPSYVEEYFEEQETNKQNDIPSGRIQCLPTPGKGNY